MQRERLSLEQLKAMSVQQLKSHWSNGGHFPFDRAFCGSCLTLHAIEICTHHPEITKQLLAMEPERAWFSEQLGQTMHDHLEELYALRLFYDHLYPQPAAAQPDLGVDAVALSPSASEQLEQMVESDRDWSSGTR